MIWISIWKITLVLALLLFSIVSIVVIIGGAKELIKLSKEL
tara:strand:+ start:1004 stop:1126 length:123 start_codon:yes stop_codon:yes gene_type:complete